MLRSSGPEAFLAGSVDIGDRLDLARFTKFVCLSSSLVYVQSRYDHCNCHDRGEVAALGDSPVQSASNAGQGGSKGRAGCVWSAEIWIGLAWLHVAKRPTLTKDCFRTQCILYQHQPIPRLAESIPHGPRTAALRMLQSWLCPVLQLQPGCPRTAPSQSRYASASLGLIG